jgi:hypothetical protein
VQEDTSDPELDRLLTNPWSAEAYGVMVNSRRINQEDLSRNWRFDPGQDTGIAHIFLPGLERTFSYTAIRAVGSRNWRFEGTTLQMNLRSDTVLAVQYVESGGGLRTLLFVSLPSEVDDLIIQETARRDGLFGTIFNQGPSFTSNNYGTISFTGTGEFSWTGYNLLIPQVIPEAVEGNGIVAMDLFLSPSLQERYDGAFSLRFRGAGGPAATVRFMYTLDNQGFRIEYVPDTSLDDITVARRASSPMVLYFFRAER